MSAQAEGGRQAALGLLRQAQDRAFEREGVPMVLALVSEVAAVPATQDPAVRADGERLGGLLKDLKGQLLPTARADDMGCVISVLQAASYSDFGPPALP